jgi:hypothetical protein
MVLFAPPWMNVARTAGFESVASVPIHTDATR